MIFVLLIFDNHIFRILLTLVPFESAFKTLSSGTKNIKIRIVLLRYHQKQGKNGRDGLLSFEKRNAQLNYYWPRQASTNFRISNIDEDIY